MNYTKMDAKKKILLNYTGKEVILEQEEGKELYSSNMRLPSVGFATIERYYPEDGQKTYDFFHTLNCEVVGLPAPQTNVFFIVNRPIAELLSSWRFDLIIPWPVVEETFGSLRCRDFTKIQIVGF